MAAVCDKDCFHCPYPDCINDEMDHEDYVASAQRDKELRATPKSKKLAAQQKAIRQVRQELGLSLRAAAGLLNVSDATVSFWERGLVPCDWERAIRILKGA